MRPIRWHKPKWLPSLLALPIPEPYKQATQILGIQRTIVLPVKAVFAAAVFFYLLYTQNSEVSFSPGNDIQSPRQVVLEFLLSFFILYVVFNAVAAVLLVLKRFPTRLVPWVVFVVGLVDGLMLAGLTVETGGFDSWLFWFFPGLMVINALSIPLATPQIVLNLSLCAFYLGAGIIHIGLAENGLSLPANPQPNRNSKFYSDDILNVPGIVDKLKQTNAVYQYLNQRLSPATRNLLSAEDPSTNGRVQQDLADDFNHITEGAELIYTPQRFAGVVLSSNTATLLNSKDRMGTNFIKLNRSLLLDAFPRELARKARAPTFMEGVPFPPDEAPERPNAEFFILRLIILLLITASCYGVQLLSFRQRLSDEEARKSAARNDELRAAGRLAAEIAHQLKNPLGIINNAAFSLSRGLKDGRNDFDLQLEIIREEIERSDRIITQLMGYAQLSEGRVEKLVLPDELERAVLEVFPPGTTYEIQVHRDFAPNLPNLLMQRTHFSVVLVNILQNAREALNGHGNIHLRARSPDESCVEVVIEDDGPGIAPEKQNKVFEAYYTSKEKGTGLGLAIVKHNVELYGGAVWVESTLGKGARFVISFPAKTLIKAI